MGTVARYLMQEYLMRMELSIKQTFPAFNGQLSSNLITLWKRTPAGSLNLIERVVVPLSCHYILRCEIAELSIWKLLTKEVAIPTDPVLK